MPDTTQKEAADLLEQVSGGNGTVSSDGDQAHPEHSTAPADGQYLAKNHRRMLFEESAISPEVVAARGYRTIASPKDLADLGFAPSQRRVPGLLLPLHPTAGGPSPLAVYRPDQPRELHDRRTGKVRVLKYEAPKGSGTRLDCPPTCQPMLADPSIPLWLTEGQKKADSLASRGLCAVALLGVWNWRGRNDFGGVVVLADFDFVALNGRDVRLVFDSDVMVKPQVRAALDRLTAVLQRKGGHVAAVYLPGGKGGKVGVDDWLAQGHDVEELEALVEAPRPELKAAAPQVELLDAPPAVMRRPLQIIGDHGYAAAWLPVRVTVRESLDKSGNVVTHDPPVVRNETRLFVVRDDGAVFGDGAESPMDSLGFEVLLPEVPLPTKTWSSPGVKRYAAGQRPDPADVFERGVAVIDRFLDFSHSLADQRVVCELLMCHVLHSYSLDAFQVTGHLWPNGDRGAGKTKLLHVHTQLSYLGQVILSGGSYASLRDLADYGAVLAFDDAENVSNVKLIDPDKRALLLAGNRRGSVVTLKEPQSDGTWRTRYVDAYCPRLFSAIRLPDPVLGSRSIVIPLLRSSNRDKANADPLDREAWPHDRRRLVDDLWGVALANLVAMQRYDRQAAERARLSGRALEPWRGPLAVALWLEEAGVDGLFQRMEAVSVDYQKERPELELSDVTVLLLKALRKLALPDGYDGSDGPDGFIERQGSVVVTSREVRETFDTLAEEQEIDIAWMGEASRRTLRIGHLLRKLRFEKGDSEKERGWKIDLRHLGGLLSSYAINVTPPSMKPSGPSEPSGPSGAPPDADAGNGHHGPVDPARDMAPYSAYCRAAEARGQVPLSVPEWAQAGRPKGPPGDDGEWLEIAPDDPQEPGGVFRMDLATGKSYRRAGGAI